MPNSDMGALIVADGLSYAAGGRNLLQDAALVLHAGRVTALIGPNGAGKSTLLRLLTGEFAPTAGRVRFGSTPLAAIPGWRLAAMRAVMAQQSRLAFPFSVWEVARLGIEGVGRALPRPRREALITACLAAADVLDLAARPFQTLSGGEQQRVHFARALCQLEAGRDSVTTQALFLDEPVANLDLCHQLGLLERARLVARNGTAVLVVLHDLNLAVTYADELVVMKQAQIVARGAPDAILDDALIADVFDIDLSLRRIPPDSIPFLLPQQRRPA